MQNTKPVIMIGGGEALLKVAVGSRIDERAEKSEKTKRTIRLSSGSAVRVNRGDR